MKRPDKAKSRSQAGTTLIEVLVAVTLLSLLSVAMAFALRIGINAYQKTSAKLMENRRVAGAQRILEQELEGIVPAVAPCGLHTSPGEQPNPNWFAFFQAAPSSDAPGVDILFAAGLARAVRRFWSCS